jgi:hypothetical protein
LSSPCHQSHQFAKCTLPNCQVHVIKVTNLQSAHCQIVKSMSSKSPICEVHIAKLSSPCHQSHQFAKCALPNCQVHVINPHYQCHIAKSPSTCRLPIKLSKIMKVYGWPDSWIFFSWPSWLLFESQKHCPKKKIAHN